MAAVGAAPSQRAQPGASPYGPLADQPDENGLLLPEGFTSRIVAVAGEPVGDTDYRWPAFPDGAACFATDDGGWIHAVNSEVTAVFAPAAGGVAAIRYDADGAIVDAYPILEASTSNCAGGPTPWGTWMSCEEPLDQKGRLWECDPTGDSDPVAHEAMGIWRREAAAVDPEGEAVYMTEDEGNGLLYRFTPTAYPDLSEGLLEAALVDDDGNVTWAEVPDPSAASQPTRDQVPAARRFDGGEGLWYHDGWIYFTTKGDHSVHAVDLAAQRYELIWKGDPDGKGVEGAVLSHVDNITVDDQTGDLFVAEDGANMEVVIITADGVVAPFARIPEGTVAPFARIPEGHDGSEITGPCFNPDRTRLYFSSQRGPSPKGLNEIIPGATQDAKVGGITYEVTGPFRAGADQAPASPTTTLANAAADGAASDEDDDGANPAVIVGGAAIVAAAAAGGAIALRNRRAGKGQPPAEPAS
jgi:hypothetical protein